MKREQKLDGFLCAAGMARKREKSRRVIASNVFAVMFPWISVGFLCTVPDFLNHIRRGNSTGLFYMIYVIYLLAFALFLDVLLCRGECVFAVADMIGLISAAAFHVPAIWEMLPHKILISILGAFPCSYFLAEILGIVYLLNIVVFHFRKHRKAAKGGET